MKANITSVCSTCDHVHEASGACAFCPCGLAELTPPVEAHDAFRHVVDTYEHTTHATVGWKYHPQLTVIGIGPAALTDNGGTALSAVVAEVAAPRNFWHDPLGIGDIGGALTLKINKGPKVFGKWLRDHLVPVSAELAGEGFVNALACPYRALMLTSCGPGPGAGRNTAGLTDNIGMRMTIAVDTEDQMYLVQRFPNGRRDTRTFTVAQRSEVCIPYAAAYAQHSFGLQDVGNGHQLPALEALMVRGARMMPTAGT